jgi:hypothetical protein
VASVNTWKCWLVYERRRDWTVKQWRTYCKRSKTAKRSGTIGPTGEEDPAVLGMSPVSEVYGDFEVFLTLYRDSHEVLEALDVIKGIELE